MPGIQDLLKMLQSTNANRRYEACELLRVSPSLPPEALDALRLAAGDANLDVADAARRALALHTAPVAPDIQPGTAEAKSAAGMPPHPTFLPQDLTRARRKSALAWAIALPLGWLSGWALGAAIAYNTYVPHESIPPGRVQAFREDALARAGGFGGIIGLLIAWLVASVITLLALRSLVPALRPSQVIWAAFWSALPVILIWLLFGGL